jgi:imidazolonepropionase-like amidohydrolase
MMRFDRKHLLGSIALAIGAASSASATTTLIDGVTIVDPRNGSLRPKMAILIDGDHILRVGAAGSFRGVKVDQRIAGGSRYVVPGFLDMHAHPLDPSDPRASLPTMVSYGVTGYRQMGGSPQLLADRRTGRLPTGLVPELLAMPGMVMASPALSTSPQAAIDEVRKQKAEGADFIKIVELAPSSFFATLAEAKLLGMPAVGHLPPTIDVRDAVRDGMVAIEHLGPNAAILEACSTDEAAVRDGYRAIATEGRKIAFDLPAAQLKRLTANPMLLSGPKGYAIYAHLLDTYDEGKCRALAHLLAGSDSWQVPTLIREKSMEFGNDPMFRGDPRLALVPAADRAMWRQVGEDFDSKLSATDRATLARLFDRQLKLVKMFDEAGVKMLAGSDMGGIWLIGGVSLHQEFDLLGLAGLSPLRVLQMTTINGARFLHREASMGAVEAGKRADLVLLGANPLASIANLHRIEAVVLRGIYLPKAKLEAMRREVLKIAG